MNIPNPRTQIPEGVRDRLPREAAHVRRLSARLEALFRSWGYREVVTPGFEYLETVATGAANQAKREDLYQFFDRKGRTLALRADMTTPIARLVSTKMVGESMPLRLSYFAPVFRHRGLKTGSANEIWQAGIELVGAEGAAADAEVVAAACAALYEAGLEGIQIGLGHVGFVEGIFAEVAVAPALEAELQEAMSSRDLVAFEKGICQANLPAEKAALLLSLATFQGGYEQAVERYRDVANPLVAQALQQLGQTLALLESFGVRGAVSLDLGMVPSLGYYTGVVFEGYSPGVGSPVVNGGRYDHLLRNFGSDAPATGFALEMDRLLVALEHQGRMEAEPALDVIVACPTGQEAQAMLCARKLRAAGLTVEVDLTGRCGAELLQYAQTRGAGRVVSPEGTSIPTLAR